LASDNCLLFWLHKVEKLCPAFKESQGRVNFKKTEKRLASISLKMQTIPASPIGKWVAG